MKSKDVLAMLSVLVLCLTGCTDVTLPNDSISSTHTTITTTATVIKTTKNEDTTTTTISTTAVTTSKSSTNNVTSPAGSKSKNSDTTSSTTKKGFPTGYNSTTATPKEKQFTEKISDGMVEKHEITIFYLDEQPFDKLVRNSRATSFHYTAKKTYPQDGNEFSRGLVSPFRVNERLINFAAHPSKIEEYLQKNKVDAKVIYTALIYTQFVSVTIYVKTTDAVYYITVDDEPGDGHDASEYIYCYNLYNSADYIKYVKESREEHKNPWEK